MNTPDTSPVLSRRDFMLRAGLLTAFALFAIWVFGGFCNRDSDVLFAPIHYCPRSRRYRGGLADLFGGAEKERLWLRRCGLLGGQSRNKKASRKIETARLIATSASAGKAIAARTIFPHCTIQPLIFEQPLSRGK